MILSVKKGIMERLRYKRASDQSAGINIQGWNNSDNDSENDDPLQGEQQFLEMMEDLDNISPNGVNLFLEEASKKGLFNIKRQSGDVYYKKYMAPFRPKPRYISQPTSPRSFVEKNNYIPYDGKILTREEKYQMYLKQLEEEEEQ